MIEVISPFTSLFCCLAGGTKQKGRYIYIHTYIYMCTYYQHLTFPFSRYLVYFHSFLTFSFVGTKDLALNNDEV